MDDSRTTVVSTHISLLQLNVEQRLLLKRSIRSVKELT